LKAVDRTAKLPSKHGRERTSAAIYGREEEKRSEAREEVSVAGIGSAISRLLPWESRRWLPIPV